jgi:hypothetical protein
MAGIFVSYRREDSSGWAGRLCEGLRNHFSADRVFFDIETLEPGSDYADAIERSLASCTIALAVIGPRWLDVKNHKGERRLDDPFDLTRLEVAIALKRDIPVIPVLVGGASMPLAEQLPDDIQKLAKRNAYEISDRRWDYDEGQLTKYLESRLTKSKSVFARVLSLRSRKALFAAFCIVFASGFGVLLLQKSNWLLGPIKPVTNESKQEGAQPSDGKNIGYFLGSWKNMDEKTRGITRIAIRNEGKALLLQVWGRCHPTDCDWGSVQATAFSGSIEGRGSDIRSIGAVFKTGFAETNLSIYPVDGNIIRVESTTHFTDRSGRSDYAASERLSCSEP